MMKQFDNDVKIPRHILYAGALLVSSGFCFYFYFFKDFGVKYNSFLLGLGVGLLLILLQFFLNWKQYKENETIRKLGVKKILTHREERQFYSEFLASADSKIDMMGVTSSRLLEHFADEDSAAAEQKVLLDRLIHKVEVRFLICAENYLEKEDEKLNTQKAAPRLNDLSQKYKKFKYAYYEHIPTHSIFVCDDLCIIGPVFPGTASKHTPCILIKTDSQYAKNYLKYFENEWEKYSKK